MYDRPRKWPAREAANDADLEPLVRGISGDRIDVTVPSHRLDVNLEIDLVEEVARVAGYERIPTRDEIAIRLKEVP